MEKRPRVNDTSLHALFRVVALCGLFCREILPDSLHPICPDAPPEAVLTDRSL